MAHWFHRNPLKATSSVNFDVYRSGTTNSDASKLLADLKGKRRKLLELIRTPESELADVTTFTTEYLSTLRGIIQGSVEESGREEGVRHLVVFRWTNTVQGKKVSELMDAQFELVSVLVNVALWHMKHAAHLAANPEISMEEAKEVHRTLRIGAGMFTLLKDSEVQTLHDTGDKGADTDVRILDAYIMQCQAEAQEVTLARAIELKHKHSLVSALAAETSKMFMIGGDSLTTLDQLQVGKWHKYMAIKDAFYKAYAYCYLGLDVLAQDKCGEAIACLRESSRLYAAAEKLSKEYASMKGPGTHCRPHEHVFFRKLGPLVKSTLEKCEHENGFIYFHKVPDQPPELPVKATFGLASAEPYALPPVNPAWTEDALKSLKSGKTPHDKPEGAAVAEEIKPIPEPNVSTEPAPAPSTSSGCVVS
ncbi:BRO1 domain-containing protein BROX-like [Corticium candelabrum]|uniref:BRO1 domain-containing protein BROX-like n=1 Tax=Corticium candelabrum TaxID=121492 RepID=UPI002E2582CF|nr:BRO1 domain-containing protein BROX-like [Corticium candelabrum]